MPSTDPKDLKIRKEIAVRFNEILHQMGISVKDLSKELGYQRSDNIYNALSGELFPGVQLLVDMLNKFENFDIVWLLTGKSRTSTSTQDEVTIPVDEKVNTKDLAEIKATLQVIVPSLLKLMKDFYNDRDPNRDVLEEYGIDLEKQLRKLRK